MNFVYTSNMWYTTRDFLQRLPRSKHSAFILNQSCKQRFRIIDASRQYIFAAGFCSDPKYLIDAYNLKTHLQVASYVEVVNNGIWAPAYRLNKDTKHANNA